MDSDHLSPQSPADSPLLLEYEAEAELLNSEKMETNYLESEYEQQSYWPVQKSVPPPPSFSTLLHQINKPALIVGAGLDNLGNTCFLNSVMQCFIHTVPLLHGLLTVNHSNCDKEGFCILCVLRGLINHSLTWIHGSVSLTWKAASLSPWILVNNLSYFSSNFQRFQQEDAHEFLQCFLDKLESCHDSSQNNNIVKQVFGGRIVSKLKCCNCGHCSDTYEPSIDLSLEIEDADNILTALQSFTTVEKLEDPETKFTCENCKEQVSVEKQLSFDEAPTVAVFQLKRFKNDGCLVEKIDKHVAFPLDLDLLPFTASGKKNDMELKYVLYAIVVHDGLTSTSGHYYCFIRLSPNMWCKFDDSRVVLVSEDFVLSQEAYILFYAKEATSWFSSFIETQRFSSVDSYTRNTSPKSVLDRVGTPSSVSPNLQNKFSRDCNETSHDIGPEHRGVDNNVINDSGQMHDKFEINRSKDNLHTIPALKAPCPSVSSDEPSPQVHKEVSPTLREKASVVVNFPIDTPEKPLRSPSPEIYREDPTDAGYHIPRDHVKVVNRVGVACKRRLEKEMDDSETRQACSFIKKSMHGSRGQQMLAALMGSKAEASANRRIKSRRSVHDDSSIRPVRRPLVAGTHR